MQTPRPDHFTYPADKARGGDIVLKRPWQRAVFVAGLVGIVLVGIALV